MKTSLLLLAFLLVSGCGTLKPRPDPDSLRDVPPEAHVRVTLRDPASLRYTSYLVDVHGGRIIEQSRGETRESLDRLLEVPAAEYPTKASLAAEGTDTATGGSGFNPCKDLNDDCTQMAGHIIVDPPDDGPIGHERIVQLARWYASGLFKQVPGYKLVPKLRWELKTQAPR